MSKPCINRKRSEDFPSLRFRFIWKWILFELALPEPHFVEGEADRNPEMVFGNEFYGRAPAVDVFESHVYDRLVGGEGESEPTGSSNLVHVVSVDFQVGAVVEQTGPIVDSFDIATHGLGAELGAYGHFQPVVKLSRGGLQLSGVEVGKLGIGPVLISDVGRYGEPLVIVVADTPAIGRGQRVVVLHVEGVGIGDGARPYVVGAGVGFSQQGFARGVDDTEREGVLLVPFDGILCAELQVEISHFQVGLEYTAAAACGDDGIGIGEGTEQVADVGTYREAFEQIAAHAHVGLRDVALARAAVRAVVDGVGKGVAHVGVGEQPDASGHVAPQGKLHDDIVDRPALLVLFQRSLAGRGVLVGEADVKQESERVHTGI